MTGKERIEAVLSGETPDQVPFAPNIGQWFSYHKVQQSLPDELADCEDEIDAMITLGADILSRRCQSKCILTYNEDIEFDGSHTEEQQLTDCIYDRPEFSKPGFEMWFNFKTPLGELREEFTFSREAWSLYEKEFKWCNWDSQYDIVCCLLESSTYTFDVAGFEQAYRRVGNHGVVMVVCPPPPLKHLLTFAGPERGLLWAMDYPKEMQALGRIHTESVRPAVEQIAAHPNTRVCCIQTNLDSQFFPPFILEDFEREYIEMFCEIMHAAGKKVYVHGCGNSKAILDIVNEMGFDAIEGITHAPLGDIVYRDVLEEMGDHFIVHGGMSCYEQEVKSNAREFLDDYCKTLFESMKPLDRFVFSSSCNTSPHTSWDTLRYFRDYCHKYGRIG